MNISTHPHFILAKRSLKMLTAQNFPQFLDEIDKFGDTLSANWKTFSYGFSPAEKRFYGKDGKFSLDLLQKAIKGKFLGDCLEMFCAAFLQYFSTDTTFGLVDGSYQFISDDEDLGCDGVAELTTSHSKAFIQAKWRTNPNEKPFNVEVFSKLFTVAMIKYGMDYKDSMQRMIFFTNINVGKRQDWTAKTGPFNELVSMCKISAILIGKNEIEQYVGGCKTTNEDFWAKFNSCFNE